VRTTGLLQASNRCSGKKGLRNDGADRTQNHPQTVTFCAKDSCFAELFSMIAPLRGALGSVLLPAQIGAPRTRGRFPPAVEKTHASSGGFDCCLRRRSARCTSSRFPAKYQCFPTPRGRTATLKIQRMHGRYQYRSNTRRYKDTSALMILLNSCMFFPFP